MKISKKFLLILVLISFKNNYLNGFVGIGGDMGDLGIAYPVYWLYKTIKNLVKQAQIREEEKRICEENKINKFYPNGMTALMIACADGNIDIVESLINAGAEINLKSKEGYTAYDYAIGHKHENIANILTEQLEKEMVASIIKNIKNKETRKKKNEELICTFRQE